jgi:NAD(P)-dependent dehydrogenase (short-subunit alcohol dehydrogenase family)
MLLKNKVAVIYGAGGAVGSAVAVAFAKEGARVFLTGRTASKVELVARAISSDSGVDHCPIGQRLRLSTAAYKAFDLQLCNPMSSIEGDAPA